MKNKVYIVEVEEVTRNFYRVEADNEREARNIVADAGGEEIQEWAEFIDFHNDPDYWAVELEEKLG